MAENISKLALGSANFGLDYGLANGSGKISESELAGQPHLESGMLETFLGAIKESSGMAVGEQVEHLLRQIVKMDNAQKEHAAQVIQNSIEIKDEKGIKESSVTPIQDTKIMLSICAVLAFFGARILVFFECLNFYDFSLFYFWDVLITLLFVFVFVFVFLCLLL